MTKKDLLTLSDLGADALSSLIERALFFKANQGVHPVLSGKMLGLIFEKESTRTRVSFEVAMHRLGGASLYLNQDSSQLSRGESYADTARVLSRYLNGLVLRTFSHDRIEELARYASVPVINGLTDSYHPCQILADLMTLIEEKKSLKGLKIAYLGDGNNMANTWIEAAMLLGFSLHVATPKGYEPEGKIIKKAQRFKNITLGNDPLAACEGADALNTDTWFSMGQKVTEAKRKKFKGFQVNASMLKKAAKNAVVLHCLPAHRGEEITDEVLDGPQSVVFDEAENRLYVQMALLESLMK